MKQTPIYHQDYFGKNKILPLHYTTPEIHLVLEPVQLLVQQAELKEQQLILMDKF